MLVMEIEVIYLNIWTKLEQRFKGKLSLDTFELWEEILFKTFKFSKTTTVKF